MSHMHEAWLSTSNLFHPWLGLAALLQKGGEQFTHSAMSTATNCYWDTIHFKYYLIRERLGNVVCQTALPPIANKLFKDYL